MKNKEITDNELIKAIRLGGRTRNDAWEYIYKAWRAYYLKPVLTLNGHPDEVDEIIGLVIIDVEKQLLKDEFKFKTVNFIQYFSICVKNAWIKNTRRSVQFVELNEEHFKNKNFEPEVNSKFDELELSLSKIGDTCKKILTLWSERYKMEDIAKIMGLKSAQSAKNAKLECYKKLMSNTNIHG